jgi:hypothetical protein
MTDDDWLRDLERERLRLVSPHAPQRDRTTLPRASAKGKARLDAAVREKYGKRS